MKFAVTCFAVFMVNEQIGPLLEQSPLQPAKLYPVAAVGVRVTVVPRARLVAQFPGQLMEPVLDATEPFPCTDARKRKLPPAGLLPVPEAGVGGTEPPLDHGVLLGWYVGPELLVAFALLGVVPELICRGPEHAEQ